MSLASPAPGSAPAKATEGQPRAPMSSASLRTATSNECSVSTHSSAVTDISTATADTAMEDSGRIVDTRVKRPIDDVDSDSEQENLKFVPGGYGERWRLLRPFMLRRRRRLPRGCLVPEPSVDHSC